MKKFLTYRDATCRKQVLNDVVVPSSWSFRRSMLVISMLLGIGCSVPATVFAAAPMSDDELDSKYLDVPVKSPYLSKVEFDKANAHQSLDTKAGIASVNGSTVLVFANSAANPLLAGIDQNTRLLGSSDSIGVPVGISSSAIPPAFGSENYSYKWAGNLDQVYVATPDSSRVMQYYYSDNGAEVWYVPVNRTGRTESFVHN